MWLPGDHSPGPQPWRPHSGDHSPEDHTLENTALGTTPWRTQPWGPHSGNHRPGDHTLETTALATMVLETSTI